MSNFNSENSFRGDFYFQVAVDGMLIHQVDSANGDDKMKEVALTSPQTIPNGKVSKNLSYDTKSCPRCSQNGRDKESRQHL